MHCTHCATYHSHSFYPSQFDWIRCTITITNRLIYFISFNFTPLFRLSQTERVSFGFWNGYYTHISHFVEIKSFNISCWTTWCGHIWNVCRLHPNWIITILYVFLSSVKLFWLFAFSETHRYGNEYEALLKETSPKRLFACGYAMTMGSKPFIIMDFLARTHTYTHRIDAFVTGESTAQL